MLCIYAILNLDIFLEVFVMKKIIFGLVVFLPVSIIVLVLFYTVLLRLSYSFSWKKVLEFSHGVSNPTDSSIIVNINPIFNSKDYNLNRYTEIELADHKCNLLAVHWNKTINGLAPDPRTYKNSFVCWFYSDNKNDNNQTNRILYFDPLQYNLQKLLSVGDNIIFRGKDGDIVEEITSLILGDFETLDGIIRKNMNAKFIIVEVNKNEQISNVGGTYRIGFVD